MGLKLPTINGLLHAAAQKEKQAAQDAVECQSQTKCPRSPHEAGLSADRLAKQAGVIRAYAADTAEMIIQIETILACIESKPTTTDSRTLAQRDLENAVMRLRRELGDEPKI